MSGSGARYFGLAVAAALAVLAATCKDDDVTGPTVADRPLDQQLVAQGKLIFRFDTFGDEVFWTDTARLHEVIRTAVSPTLAMQVGLKVDLDTLPAAVRDQLRNGQINLNSPATTVTLLKLGAVVGVVGTVQTVAGRDSLVRVGLTCALCHSTVDNSFAPGIGRRLDGYPNRDLNVGAIVALSPAIPAAQKTVFNSWGKGKYDPRFNIDGRNGPVVIPAAFGLKRVRKEIYTGDDTISYWNSYVAVTQMHGQGSFRDTRLNINLVRNPDLVTPKLPALREYQHSLATPPVTRPVDVEAVARGRMVFRGQGRCVRCHIPDDAFTDSNREVLHLPSETGMDSAYAGRSITKKYRTTPLRGLWRPPHLQGPYFHDGSAATLEAVVDHYARVQSLNLSGQQKADLVAYLKTL